MRCLSGYCTSVSTAVTRSCGITWRANILRDICGNLSGIFSGILAFAFDHLSGAGGLSGWQWLFLIESIVTIIMGVAVWFIMPDCEPTVVILLEGPVH